MVKKNSSPAFLFTFSLSLVFLFNQVYSFEDNNNVLLQLNLKNLDFKHKTYTSNRFSSKYSRTEKGVTILQMKHKDHCNSRGNIEKRILLDETRVKSLQLRIQNAGILDTRIPLKSGIDIQSLNYIVTLELGGKQITGIVDTGSDLTWVQCEPCRLCYMQKDPIFNPSLSESYKTIPCNSTTCESLKLATGNEGVCGYYNNTQICNYVVSYGDGSYTIGELGRESLKLGDVLVNGFVFGCGKKNKGLFGGASGIIGLARSELSLVSQTYEQFGGFFSYCLPTTEADSSGSLIFGDNSSLLENTTQISYTKMVKNPLLPTFYFLNLTGIQIGGVELKDENFGKKGFLIDSGTVITRLPPSIYNAVKTEFVKQVSGFPLVSGFSILDTCFDLSGYKEVEIPKIEMKFEGDDVGMSVDVNGVFYFVKIDGSLVCLALASLSNDEEIGIIGNFQQRNRRVVYDTKNSLLGFAEETCSFS